MSGDTIDLRFLGAQVQTLQGDLRDLRASYLRLDEAVAGLRTDFGRLEARIEAKFEQIDARFDRLEARFDRLEARVGASDTEMRDGFRAVDARLDQMSQTMATNLSLVLAAIENKRGI